MESINYKQFLKSKKKIFIPTGFEIESKELNEKLFDFQKDIIKWSLKKGRAAIFADCGLGKTPMQLEWAHHVNIRTRKPVLILAPLAVSQQTVREGKKFGIAVEYLRKMESGHNIIVTNYEMLDKFNGVDFGGVILDESSILKSYTGKIRNEIIGRFKTTQYKLACTATPAPNDHMELGNHSEFLGALTRTEMLSVYFVHDGGETQKWRIKGHATRDYWEWVCSWAVMIKKPSDLGYSDNDFILPNIEYHEITVENSIPPKGMLFAINAITLDDRRQARKSSISDRVSAVVDIVNKKPNESWLIWCNLNDESNMVSGLINDAVEITGSDSVDKKEKNMLGFTTGENKIIVSKPLIAGFGMNWQHCHNIVFLGLSDSYEQFYQAIRRCWRFGQKNTVNCYIVTSKAEGNVVKNIKRKETEAEKMAQGMLKNMNEINKFEIKGGKMEDPKVNLESVKGNGWEMVNGDCVEHVKNIKSDSIHYSIFSPPFASLYTYSDSHADMGNCLSHDDFYNHFKYLVNELYRVIMPGRLISFHCMNLPTSKERDGFIGIRDFRGKLINMFEDSGFIYHSEVCIWKDPVTAMQRTKAIGLLWKQLKKDSTISRQGIADYLVTMRKPGENPERVSHTPEDFPVSLWQKYASPVWFDINPSKTLQRESAREHNDERHICPLQLEVIERAVKLWSNEGDLVLSPFAGIGSEGYVSLEMGRKFMGIELKQSYFKQACLNLKEAESMANKKYLFKNEAS